MTRYTNQALAFMAALLITATMFSQTLIVPQGDAGAGMGLVIAA